MSDSDADGLAGLPAKRLGLRKTLSSRTGIAGQLRKRAAAVSGSKSAAEQPGPGKRHIPLELPDAKRQKGIEQAEEPERSSQGGATRRKTGEGSVQRQDISEDLCISFGNHFKFV